MKAVIAYRNSSSSREASHGRNNGRMSSVAFDAVRSSSKGQRPGSHAGAIGQAKAVDILGVVVTVSAYREAVAAAGVAPRIAELLTTTGTDLDRSAAITAAVRSGHPAGEPRCPGRGGLRSDRWRTGSGTVKRDRRGHGRGVVCRSARYLTWDRRVRPRCSMPLFVVGQVFTHRGRSGIAGGSTWLPSMRRWRSSVQRMVPAVAAGQTMTSEPVTEIVARSISLGPRPGSRRGQWRCGNR